LNTFNLVPSEPPPRRDAGRPGSGPSPSRRATP
jgi:hypothetical protein